MFHKGIIIIILVKTEFSNSVVTINVSLSWELTLMKLTCIFYSLTEKYDTFKMYEG